MPLSPVRSKLLSCAAFAAWLVVPACTPAQVGGTEGAGTSGNLSDPASTPSSTTFYFYDLNGTPAEVAADFTIGGQTTSLVVGTNGGVLQSTSTGRCTMLVYFGALGGPFGTASVVAEGGLEIAAGTQDVHYEKLQLTLGADATVQEVPGPPATLETLVIDGSVIDAQGAPLVAANAELDGEGAVYTTTTDDLGRFSFPPFDAEGIGAAYKLTISQGDDSWSREVTLNEGGPLALQVDW